MPRYIDADEVIKILCDRCIQNGDCIECIERDAILELPAYDVQEVKHGKWKCTKRYSDIFGNPVVRCSNCGAMISQEEYMKYVWNYCPVCGEKKDGEKK